MKKVLCVISSTILCIVAIALTASAATQPVKAEELAPERNTAQEKYEQNLQAARDIAYMDLSNLSEETRKEVIEARNTIIFSESWSADDVDITIERADGTTEIVPKFSELFPGWDMPTFEANQPIDDTVQMIGSEFNINLQ